MAATVLAFSGQIKSGKTTISRAVAEALRCPRVSFGDRVRAVVEGMGLPTSRENLQRTGESLVANNLEQFCRDVLAQAATGASAHIVVDGVRHVEAAQCLRRLVMPKDFHLVFVETDEATRETRHAARSHSERSLKSYAQHSTELQVASDLRNHADLTVDGAENLSAVVTRIVALVDQQHD